MDLTKLFLILCIVLLCVSIILCFSAYLFAHETWISAIVASTAQSGTSTTEATPADTPADILVQEFCVRESNGTVAIYTGDGYFVRYLDVEVALLPHEDQEALKRGILLSSWKELLALIEDYTE